ncbi:cyclic nucleotide-binding domain-containing protein [Rhodovulum adriaticum]|uniref:CRP/FNR family transcriptional activator FtrB n=1 Tax=Rhodovulum adriaticum TaxID=35804 RepID=A0A4R2NZ84_RHOAD|nr:cyclic nucleotide-binding domain-containing protein [Rhodovulum adriaticum]MBK1634834.1 transcriptional regulator [Rhodovulum adriaticum]TCP27590.1 CRP/FNR family transcriptional activator FtrB [Rhodovulum adriaticum]
MRDSEIREIRSLAIFAKMADEAFDRLCRGAYVQTFPPQIELITEGEPSDFLHVLSEGRVEMFARWNGRETTMALLRPVTSFILAATVRDRPYLMSARTLEKSRIILLPSEDVRAIFEEDAAFARAVVTELATDYRNVVKNTKNLKLRSSIERLANYLVRRQDRAEGARTFQLPVEKRKIASLLGMTPENFSRALRTLGEYGVEIDGLTVTIRDREDLVHFAKPTPLIDDPST